LYPESPGDVLIMVAPALRETFRRTLMVLEHDGRSETHALE